MKPKHQLLLIGTVFLALASCQNKPKLSPIVGMWKLHSMEVKDSALNWKTWRKGTQGYLLYGSKNHLALHLTINNYSNTALVFPNFTDTIATEALKHLSNNYNYMGEYHISDSVVRHIKLSHSNPAEWGDTSYKILV